MEDKYRLIREKNANILNRRYGEVIEHHPKVAQLLNEKEAYILSQKYAFASEERFTVYQHELHKKDQGIAEALAACGLPKDYLQPIFTCPACRDTGYIDGEDGRQPCHCRKQTAQPGITFDDVRLDVYESKPMDGFAKSPRENMEQILAACKAYTQSFPKLEKPNLLFFGNAGLGKTYLAKAIASAVEEKGYNTIRMNSYTLFQQFKEEQIHGVPLKEDVFHAALLIVDDFGTEPMYKNITIESFFALFNERLENSKPTIVITNLSYDEMKSRYGERLVSRLYDKHTTLRFCFYGKDLRL